MSDISFSITSCMLEDSPNKKALTPDKNGIYKGLCMMVIGDQASQNGKVYEKESMMDCLTNPNGSFYKKLKAGGLSGEYGHPDIRSEADLPRIGRIEMKNVSHVIVRAYTGKPTERGNVPVYADIRPYGPYGQYLKDSLESPVINTAFSLRSLVEKIGTTPDGNIRQRVMALVTWDAVDVGGYRCAAKVAPRESIEGLEIPIRPEKKNDILKTMVSQEVITDQELQDILQVDRVVINHTTYDVDMNGVYADGAPVSLFHSLFRKK